MRPQQLALDFDNTQPEVEPTARGRADASSIYRSANGNGHADFAHVEGLSGPRLAGHGHVAGLDDPTHALAPRRCRCERWPIAQPDGDCLKCGRHV